uniref:Uncharacterized protein n=1 Tax=Anguilla anguilla TaxID=7936 RepID=A0A0E9U9K2_ANGAN
MWKKESNIKWQKKPMLALTSSSVLERETHYIPACVQFFVFLRCDKGAL